MATKLEAVKYVPKLREFICPEQLHVIAENCYGEERHFFIDKIVELGMLIDTMPKVYEQDGMGDNAIIHLHYFRDGMDWYILERDCVEGEPQHQAFGIADLGYGPEKGYISIQELIDNGIELDLHWTPKKVKELV